jgi:hypothetical protein
LSKYKLDNIMESPKVENLDVAWIRELTPGQIAEYRRLRRSGLLQLYSMQVYEVNIGRCVPGSEGCSRCLVRKKGVEKTGWGGPHACSLTRALLAVEYGFYKMSLADSGLQCSLCGDTIRRGHWHSSVLQFGYDPLKLCLRCLMPDEFV